MPGRKKEKAKTKIVKVGCSGCLVVGVFEPCVAVFAGELYREPFVWDFVVSVCVPMSLSFASFTCQSIVKKTRGLRGLVFVFFLLFLTFWVAFPSSCRKAIVCWYKS